MNTDETEELLLGRAVSVFDDVVEKVIKRSTIDDVPCAAGEYKIAVAFYDRCGETTRQYSVFRSVIHKVVCSSTLRLIPQDMQIVTGPRRTRRRRRHHNNTVTPLQLIGVDEHEMKRVWRMFQRECCVFLLECS